MKPIVKCSEEKKAKIRESLIATKNRRAEKDMASIEFKFDQSHFNKITKHHVKMIFVEAKWLYNWYLSDSNNLRFRNPDTITSLDRDGNTVERKLNFISSQMKQSVNLQIKDNIKGLATKKSHGEKVGRLKFEAEHLSIELVQPGITFKIFDNYLKIQGLKQLLRVDGIKQIPVNADICNAKLILKPSGYYVRVTYARYGSVGIGMVGIDFGCKTQLTLSNAIAINYGIKVSERTKKAQRKLVKKEKGSKNRKKAINKLRLAHEKDTNKRKDCQNKIIGYLKTFEIVAIQDDNLSGWQKSGHGKKTQMAGLGAIKARIKNLPSVVILDRFTPTTKPCHKCGTIHKMKLSQRIFVCDGCGVVCDRDLNASRVVERIALKEKVPAEYREFTPLETFASASRIMLSPYLNVSLLSSN